MYFILRFCISIMKKNIHVHARFIRNLSQCEDVDLFFHLALLAEAAIGKRHEIDKSFDETRAERSETNGDIEFPLRFKALRATLFRLGRAGGTRRERLSARCERCESTIGHERWYGC